jgi:hypothetical protein
MPAQGDEDDDATYAGIGRVISRWEEVEALLAHLYSCFLLDPDLASLVREYGNPRIFSDRMIQLQNGAERYFVRHPNQQMEASFQMLSRRIVGFSARRNDIAHCVVRPMFWLSAFGIERSPAMSYCALPPHYTGRRFDDETNKPSYVYTSVELLQLEEQLSWLAISARQFYETVKRTLPPP